MSSAKDISKMRERLFKTREALRRALAGDASLLNELRGTSPGDMVDMTLDAANDDIDLQLAEVQTRELRRVEYALERMRNGLYGVCEGCGTTIPAARLNALPYATYCIKCQREAERQGSAGASNIDWGAKLNRADGDGSGDGDAFPGSAGKADVDMSGFHVDRRLG